MVRHSDEAVVKPDTPVGQLNPGLRIYGRCATGRSLVPSAAATQICIPLRRQKNAPNQSGRHVRGIAFVLYRLGNGRGSIISGTVLLL